MDWLDVIKKATGLLLQAYYIIGNYKQAFYYGNILISRLSNRELEENYMVCEYLAMLYFELEEFDKSFFYMAKLLKVKSASEDPNGRLQVLFNLASTMIKLERFEEGTVYLEQAECLIEMLENVPEVVRYYFHIIKTDLCIGLGLLDDARKEIGAAKGLSIVDEVDHERLHLIMMEYRFAEAKGNVRGILEKLLKGYELAVKCGNKMYTRDFLKGIFKYREGIEDLHLRLELAEAYIRRIKEDQEIRSGFLSVGLNATIERYDLSRQVQTDGLTGAYNRSFLEEYVSKNMDRSHLKCVVYDIDDFKVVNDTYGHQEGDKILRWLVKRSKEFFEDYGKIIRLGGDEFMMFIESEAMTMPKLVDRANLFLGALEEGDESDLATGVTVSMGIAAWDEAHMKDIHELIYEADMNLYKAKRRGKNMVAVMTEVE